MSPEHAPVETETDRLRSSLTTYRRISAALTAVVLILVLVVVVQAQGAVTAAPPAATTGAAPGDTPTPTATATETAQQVPDLARRDPADPLAIGAVDAPVVLIEWADYRCPFCALWATRTLPAILEEYVAAGLVRFEFNDVVYFGDDSLAAAVAGRAAGRQGMFSEYMETLYAAAPDSGHPDLPRETLVAFAEQAGIPDLERFTADLDDAELRTQVEESTAYAQSLGIGSVPFFVVGQTAFAGAQSVDTFRQVLDAELAAAQG